MPTPLRTPSVAPDPSGLAIGGRLLSTLVMLTLYTGCTAAPESGADDADGFAGVPVEGAFQLPEMALPAVGGEDRLTGRVALGDVLNRPVNLIFIGFTNCPDICPVHLANLGAVLRELPLEQEREVAVAFVTADPGRDSLERIDEWLDALYGKIVGFRPTRAEVAELERALGVQESVLDPEGNEGDYFVAHAGQILALDAEGRVRLAYPFGIRQRDWKADLPKLIRGEWPEVGAAQDAPGAGASPTEGND